ncbi:hypothetical protein TNCV_1128791 [Trichonephila clavipes]|nr:hypothetical protein TNCV_1128791 [Trichonephila clavipes]
MRSVKPPNNNLTPSIKVLSTSRRPATYVLVGCVLDTPAVDDDNVYTAPIKANKDILEFVHSSKSIIDADSDDENETNNTAPVPTSAEMKNVEKIKTKKTPAIYSPSENDISGSVEKS